MRELAEGADDRRVLFVLQGGLEVVALLDLSFAVGVVGFVGC